MKLNFEQIVENALGLFDPTRVRQGSIAVIDGEALALPQIKDKIIEKKGPSYLAQLEKMAKDGQTLYVSALKKTRASSSNLTELNPTDFDEADVMDHKYPGVFTSPMTVPFAILKMVTDPSNIMQHPVSDDIKKKAKIGTDLQDDAYNKGKQPKGTLKGESTSVVQEGGIRKKVIVAIPDHTTGGVLRYYHEGEGGVGPRLVANGYTTAKVFDSLFAANTRIRALRKSPLLKGYELRAKDAPPPTLPAQ